MYKMDSIYSTKRRKLETECKNGGGIKEENIKDKKMTVVWVGTFAVGLMIEKKEENSGFESDQNVRIYINETLLAIQIAINYLQESEKRYALVRQLYSCNSSQCIYQQLVMYHLLYPHQISFISN